MGISSGSRVEVPGLTEVLPGLSVRRKKTSFQNELYKFVRAIEQFSTHFRKATGTRKWDQKEGTSGFDKREL